MDILVEGKDSTSHATDHPLQEPEKSIDNPRKLGSKVGISGLWHPNLYYSFPSLLVTTNWS